MSFRRDEYKLSLLIRDDAEMQERIEVERAWVGPIRDPAFLSGRACPADWVRSRWHRRARVQGGGQREQQRSRRGKRLVGEWHWVRA